MAENMDKVWKKFLKNHWKMLVLWIVAAIVAGIGLIYVFLWLVGEAQTVGLVPELLGLWAMKHFIDFVLHLIFWEFIYVGIPVIIFVVANYLLWWKRLPDKEKNEYREGHLFGKRSKSTDTSGIFSFIIFIAFAIKIYLDGNWSTPFATWKFDYLVSSCIWALVWILIIIGIPMLIGGSLYLLYEMKKED